MRPCTCDYDPEARHGCHQVDCPRSVYAYDPRQDPMVITEPGAVARFKEILERRDKRNEQDGS